MSSVEAFVTRIKIFGWQKVDLIVPSKVLNRLIFYRSKVKLQPHVFDSLIFAFGGYLDPLIGSQKSF